MNPNESRRPNVVIVMTDQQSWNAMSGAGHQYLNTPNLDALAAAGTRFDRAYCTQPLCLPSRSSMWTGRTPTEVGARGNEAGLSPEEQAGSLGRVMSEAGYTCGYAGKWHVPELDAPAWSGFEQIHHELEAGIVVSVSGFLARDHATPYFLVVSLTEPHGICQWARGQNPPSGPVELPADDELPPLPANYARGAYEAQLPLVARDHTPHANPIMGFDEDDWRRYLYGYHRLVERADAMVGDILDLVANRTDADDTVVIFTSDHGDQAAAHQWNQKWVLYEESIHVPLIMKGPGVAAGRTVDDLVSTGLDLYPTVTALAGLPDPQRAGRSLLPLAAEEHDGGAWRDHLFVETSWTVPGVQHLTGRTVIDGEWKYTCYAWGRNREQLINLDSDPGELHNLARYAEHRERLDRYRAMIATEARTRGDRKFAGMVPTAGSRPC